MPIDRRMLIGSGAAAMLGGAAPAPMPVPPPAAAVTAEPESIRLWPGEPPGAPQALPAPALKKEGAPGRKEYRLRGVADPLLYVYRPARPNGVGLIVMPGGGYAFLSIQNEGSAVAARFVEQGYTVFVLSYRLPAEGWADRADAPLQDAIRAIRLVRARAQAFGIAPERTGILGFSSGGHLAASLATGYGEPLYTAIDAADALSARPAFVGLGYAVTTLEPPCAGTASHRNLLGPDPSPALVAARSPLNHVGKGTPPCFLVHALDDPIVDPACGIAWLQAMRAAGVPIEAHFPERGGHGFGVRLASGNPGSLWPEQFVLWLARQTG